MTARGHIQLLALSVVAAFLLFPHQAVLAGFGVSPSRIEEDKLVPGSSFARTIYLVQGDPRRDVPIELNVDSETMKDWISFAPSGEILIPAGVQQFPLDIQVRVPRNAELGVYKAFVRINTVPERLSGDGQVAIALGGRVEMELTVGDDVFLEYEVKSIEIEDIAEGEPLSAVVRVANTGNVPTKPSAATFELFNKFGDIRLAYAQVEAFEPVDSFSESTQRLSFPIDIRLAVGEYWGHVKIYNEDDVVIKELRTVFNVHERGAFATAAALGGKASGLFGGIAGAIIIALFVLWVLFARRKKRTRRA